MNPAPAVPLKRRGVLAASAGLLVLLGMLSVVIGVADLFPVGERERWYLVAVSRLPRTLAAVLAGAALAIAGLVMQSLARNRLVDPVVSGTGQSAALGILLVTVFAPAAGLLLKSAFAAVFALVGTSFFLVLAGRLPPERPYLVPLFGLVFGGVVGALATGIAWNVDLLQFLDVWLNGEFSGVMRGRYEILFLIAAGLGAAWWTADRLTILSLGRDTSVGLGLNYAAMLQLGLVLVALLTALVVVTVGALPFVGMVVPALVARYMGDDVRAAIPVAALSGAVLVLASDIVGRLIRYPYEIPAATILGVVGSAAFLVIVFGGNRRA